ncbi:MAG: YncE family protein [Pseudomonadota bacterium]
MPAVDRIGLSVLAVAGVVLCALFAASVASAEDGQTAARADAGQTAPYRQSFRKQGLEIEASVAPVEGAGLVPGKLTEGEVVSVRLRLTDTTSGAPLRGVFPAAWMDIAAPGSPEKSCSQRVKRLLGGGIFSRAELDLNVYYVLALNADPTISVVDPLFGFGGSKLLSLIQLESPGEDWAITGDQDHLFVSMPEAGKVAVVYTPNWSVRRNIDAGPSPRRVALQPDEAFLWVSVAEDDPEKSGVSVVRTRDLTIAARIPTGAGKHDIAFSADSRYAFVTNSAAGTVSVIDIAGLKKVADIPAGSNPVAANYARRADAVYVASRDDGLVTAISVGTLKQLAQTATKPGIVQVKVAPDSRFAFLPNPAKDTVEILDLSNNRIVQTARVMEAPDQISFSDELAYVRHRDSEVVLMIPLKDIGDEKREATVVDFPGGQHPLGRTTRPSLANAIVQASGAYAVLIANPLDEAIYYYKEGMAAPMGNFSNYGHEPRAVLAVERNLREMEAGVYGTDVTLRKPGKYQFAIFLDAPRIIHCLDLTIEANPAAMRSDNAALVKVTSAPGGQTFRTGHPVELAFRLTDPVTGAPAENVPDLTVLVFSPVWQQRHIARHRGGGLYTAGVTLPRGGNYRVLVAAPSANLPFTQQFNLAEENP